MLPDPDNSPTHRSQQPVCISIALYVREDLPPPPVGICLRPGTVNGARVPEATVNEDSHLQPRKNHIGASPSTRDLALKAVTQAQGSQLASQREFAGRVLASGDLHPFTNNV